MPYKAPLSVNIPELYCLCTLNVWIVLKLCIFNFM